jgi:hypothetical protein
MLYVIVLFYITQYSVRLFYSTFTQCYVYIFTLFYISYVIYISYPIGWRDAEQEKCVYSSSVYFPSEWFSSVENKRKVRDKRKLISSKHLCGFSFFPFIKF